MRQLRHRQLAGGVVEGNEDIGKRAVPASVLLDGLSAETQGFIDGKLRELAVAKQALERRLGELDRLHYQHIDVEEVVSHGKKALGELPRLMDSGSLEERKEFIQSLVERIVVRPDEGRLEVYMKKLPATVYPQPGVFAVAVVAGARSDRVQMGVFTVALPLEEHGLVAGVAA